MNDMPYETVPCMYCGLPTLMLGTKKCNGCWEVDRNLKEFAQSEAGKKRLLEVLGVEKPDYVVILPFETEAELQGHLKAYMAFLRQLDMKVVQTPTLVTEDLLRRTTLEPGLPVEVSAALRTLRISVPQFNKMRKAWCWEDFATKMETKGQPEFSAWEALTEYVRKDSQLPPRLQEKIDKRKAATGGVIPQDAGPIWREGDPEYDEAMKRVAEAQKPKLMIDSDALYESAMKRSAEIKKSIFGDKNDTPFKASLHSESPQGPSQDPPVEEPADPSRS